MPRTSTFAELRQEARRRADMEGSSFVSDEEVGRLVNQGLAELWHVLVQSDIDRYTTRTEIQTVGGTWEYTLPDDFASARMLERLEASGSERAYRLEPHSLSEGHRTGATGVGLGIGCEGLRWLIVYQGADGSASRLRFSRDPQSGYVRLWYVQAPAVFCEDSDVWDGVAGWEEWAVLWAAEQMLLKEESDPRALIGRRMEMTKRMQNIAGDRIAGTARSVSRVRHSGRGRW